jgi:signal transduction histidine kinase
MRRFETLLLDASPGAPIVDCIRRAQPIWIPSQKAMLDLYPHLAPHATPERSYRVACLPLTAHGRVLGAIGITIEEAREVTEDERDFLLLVGRYAGQALERLRLYESERRSHAQNSQLYQETVEARSRAEQLYRFAQAVVAADRVEMVYDAAIGGIEAALGVRRAAILTYQDEDVMRFRAWRNLSETYRKAVEGHSPWMRDATAPQPVLVPDALADPALAPFASLLREEGIGALAFIPLVTRGRLLGKFMLYYERPHEFVSHEIETALAIANHLASVITRFSVLERLEETIRSNELFAGALAHDLRNPLGAIMAAAQLVLMRSEGESLTEERASKPLSRILSSGQRMSAMIDQLLDFTRARSGGGIEVDPKNTDLADLLAQVVGELDLLHPGWRIVTQVRGDASGTWDPERLLQVISNLLTNAGQHTPAGKVVGVEVDGANRERVTLRVHNQGAIPEDLLPHLFDPFRSTRHRRDLSRGLGLGLFIVREIVRAHGGSVGVTSSEEAGTTFALELPRASDRVRAARAT